MVLLSAVIISLVRFALAEIDSYREKIELMASRVVQHQVSIESLDARLVGMTPTLVLEGVHVLDKKTNTEILNFSQSSIGISLIQSFQHKKLIPKDITLSGIKLALIRHKNGEIALHGFELGEKNIRKRSNEELTNWFINQTSLALKDSTIIWQDNKRNAKSITLTDIDVELYNHGNRHQLTGSFAPELSLGKHVELAMEIQGDLTEPEQWQGKFFVRGDEIYLAQWGQTIRHKDAIIKDGVADFQIWGAWQKNREYSIDGDVSIYQLKIATPQNKQLDIGLLGGLFRYNSDQQGWSLAVERFQYTGIGGILPETDFSIIAKNNPADLQPDINVRVEKFKLESISEILVNSSLLTKQHRELLLGLSPSGIVNTLQFSRVYNKSSKAFDFLAHARLKEVSNQYFKKIPGLTNFSGSLWLNQNKGRLDIDTRDASIDFGSLFRAPINLQQVKGSLQWWKYSHGWQLLTNQLLAKNAEASTLNDISVYLPGTGPMYMDLYSKFSAAAQYKSNYLPVKIMKKPLIDWLDRSIKSGTVTNGGIVYRGRVADFPFRKPVGKFAVKLKADDLELDYQKGWPSISGARLDAYFDSKSVAINISEALLLDSAITSTSIDIADYRNPVVDINGKVKGQFRDVVRFVVTSPIPASKELLDIKYKGHATTDVSLHVPLKKGSSVGYSGIVDIDKGAIGLLAGAVDVSELEGKLAFSNDGLMSKALSAKIFGNRSNINIYSQVVGKRIKTYLATNGETEAAVLLEKFSIPAYKHVKGLMNWQVLVDFSDEQQHVPVLSISSDLVGVEMALPAPFSKPASQSGRLNIQAFFNGGGKTTFYASYGDNFTTAASLNASSAGLFIEKAHLKFAAEKATLPQDKLLYVTGRLDGFSPVKWGRHIAAYKDFTLQKSHKLPVLLSMHKLDVVIEKDKDKSEQKVNILPDNFPSLSGKIKQFVFDGMPLGKLDIKFQPYQGSLNIVKMDITSPEMKFTSSGRWNYAHKQHLSDLNVSMKSKNLGKLFNRLGLAAIINNGKADINGNIHWADTPFDFSLSKLNGNLNMYIKDGSIADIDPGAGRVVGLLSLSELPRRLMLDFSDMFKKGFVFDEIKGKFTLSNGDANTSAIKVEGTVAEVILQGRTGLANRDYDLKVNVIPKVGQTLPVASGALFGTQIGALVYLFEKIMGKELEKATEREYRVTGNWDNPQIKRIEKAEKNTNVEGE